MSQLPEITDEWGATRKVILLETDWTEKAAACRNLSRIGTGFIKPSLKLDPVLRKKSFVLRLDVTDSSSDAMKLSFDSSFAGFFEPIGWDFGDPNDILMFSGSSVESVETVETVDEEDIGLTKVPNAQAVTTKCGLILSLQENNICRVFKEAAVPRAFKCDNHLWCVVSYKLAEPSDMYLNVLSVLDEGSPASYHLKNVRDRLGLTRENAISTLLPCWGCTLYGDKYLFHESETCANLAMRNVNCIGHEIQDAMPTGKSRYRSVVDIGFTVEHGKYFVADKLRAMYLEGCTSDEIEKRRRELERKRPEQIKNEKIQHYAYCLELQRFIERTRRRDALQSEDEVIIEQFVDCLAGWAEDSVEVDLKDPKLLDVTINAFVRKSTLLYIVSNPGHDLRNVFDENEELAYTKLNFNAIFAVADKIEVTSGKYEATFCTGNNKIVTFCDTVRAQAADTEDSAGTEEKDVADEKQDVADEKEGASDENQVETNEVLQNGTRFRIFLGQDLENGFEVLEKACHNKVYQAKIKITAGQGEDKQTKVFEKKDCNVWSDPVESVPFVQRDLLYSSKFGQDEKYSIIYSKGFYIDVDDRKMMHVKGRGFIYLLLGKDDCCSTKNAIIIDYDGKDGKLWQCSLPSFMPSMRIVVRLNHMSDPAKQESASRLIEKKIMKCGFEILDELVASNSINTVDYLQQNKTRIFEKFEDIPRGYCDPMLSFMIFECLPSGNSPITLGEYVKDGNGGESKILLRLEGQPSSYRGTQTVLLVKEEEQRVLLKAGRFKGIPFVAVNGLQRN